MAERSVRLFMAWFTRMAQQQYSKINKIASWLRHKLWKRAFEINRRIAFLFAIYNAVILLSLILFFIKTKLNETMQTREKRKTKRKGGRDREGEYGTEAFYWNISIWSIRSRKIAFDFKMIIGSHRKAREEKKWFCSKKFTSNQMNLKLTASSSVW